MSFFLSTSNLASSSAGVSRPSLRYGNDSTLVYSGETTGCYRHKPRASRQWEYWDASRSSGDGQMRNDEIEYWKNRATAERRMAETASDPVAARIHSDLADAYEQRSAPEPRGRLSIITR